jgi:hypothetical protein
MRIHEIFNKIHPNKVTIHWTVNGDEHDGIFELDGNRYDIKIAKHDVTSDYGVPTTLSVYTIDFSIIQEGGEHSVLATGFNTPIPVLSAIFSGVANRVQSENLNPDVIVIRVAADLKLNPGNQLERRKAIYQRAMDNMGGGLGYKPTPRWVTGNSFISRVYSKVPLNPVQLHWCNNILRRK